MNPAQIKIAAAGLLFLLIFLSGFWLAHSGKPYGLLVFTLHKLISLGVVVFLVVTFIQYQQVLPLELVQITAVAITAVLLILTIITGGLVSVNKTMPEAVLRLHHLLPYLTVLSTAWTLYLLLFVSAGLARS